MFDLVDGQAGFVGVQDRLSGQDLPQPLFKGLQGLVLLLAGRLQGGFTDGIAEHLGAHFTDPQAGAFLGVVEVSEQRPEVLPILDRGFKVGGKGRRHEAVTAGTLFDLGPMLATFQLQGREVEDLAALKIDGGFFERDPGRTHTRPGGESGCAGECR